MKAYVEGSYIKHLKNISVGYCIVDNKRNIKDEFGMTVGYDDYSVYIQKYGEKFIGLLAICKLLEKISRSKSKFSDVDFEIYTENAFVVYVTRILQNKEQSLKLLREYIVLYPFLYLIRKYLRKFEHIKIKHLVSDKGAMALDIKGNVNNKDKVNIGYDIIMPPLNRNKHVNYNDNFQERINLVGVTSDNYMYM